MTQIGCVVANLLILAACLPRRLLFWYYSKNVRGTQARVLRSILKRNKKTEFGRTHCFEEITTATRFQEQIPLVDYDDLYPFIERISRGEDNLLTRDKVITLEPTSGTTSGSRYIPYTKRLQKEYSRGISVWLADLYLHNPGLLAGKAYWSITPMASKKSNKDNKIRIGFEDDAEYLGGSWKKLFSYLFAVPADVVSLNDINQFRYVTAAFLLKEKNLALFSIWNPTFLIILLSFIGEHFYELVNDLRTGTLKGAYGLDEKMRLKFENMLGSNPGRAEELAELMTFCRKDKRSQDLWIRIWPRLKVISCWADANASASAKELSDMFPGVLMQGKGLLATEAIVTFPMNDAKGCVLSVLSHFFEFIPVDGAGGDEALPAIPASEVQKGHTYSVVITNGGGLYRYRLRDLVVVEGFHNSCPVIRFIGKEDHVSDYVGEKLSEYHVRMVLQQACVEKGLSVSFILLAPEISERGFRYTLFIEADALCQKKDMNLLNGLLETIEKGLQENFHYAYCRKLDQIKSLALRVIKPKNGVSASDIFLRASAERGQRLGDIKPCVLHNKTGWNEVFRSIIAISVEEGLY